MDRETERLLDLIRRELDGAQAGMNRAKHMFPPGMPGLNSAITAIMLTKQHLESLRRRLQAAGRKEEKK
jgi:hypothetical protein